jgi:hypothetical protein
VPGFLAQIEGLTVPSFILLIAAIAGTVQAIPLFLHLGSVDLGRARLAQIGLATALSVVYYTGAALLWWFAVRRRQHSLWLTALQVTVALAAADLLMNGLGLVATSIETRGAFAIALGRALPDALWGFVGGALLRSPFWFIQAAALIAVGRLVLHVDALIVPPRLTRTHLGTVT